MDEESSNKCCEETARSAQETFSTSERISSGIPEDQRSPSLVGALHHFGDLIVGFKKANKDVKYASNAFYQLCYPWLIDAQGDAEVEAKLAERRRDLEKRGFDGTEVRRRLEQIISEDKHLRNCCTNSAYLALYLDNGFIGLVSFLKESDSFNEETYKVFLKSFLDSTYAQPFRKQAVSHLYNFNAEDDRLEFEGIRVVKLDSATISKLIGEPTFPAFIHPKGVGDYFVVTEEGGPSDDVINWLFSERSKATEFASVLQYFKNGLVHVDYTVPHFLPLWVNDLRKRGIFFIGDPHRTPYAQGQKPYQLNRVEMEQVNTWWRTYTSELVVQSLANSRNKFRQLIQRAGDFYELYHERKDAPSRLIDLAIALEALFTPSNKGELIYRIAYAASHLVGRDATERKEIFGFVKKMYSLRSSLFHGQYDVNDYYEGRFVTDEQTEQLASIIRRAILRFLVLYLRGHSNIDEVRSRLSDCVLDSDAVVRLQSESDPETFLKEVTSKLAKPS
ncbi:MAG TPA: hypothetical protein VF525_16535 [Pyrinomonadaceae bacterium]|jgi:hypothetical protein